MPNEQTPSPDQLRFSHYGSPLDSNNVSPSGPTSSVAPSPASAHPPDDHNSPRYFGTRSNSRSVAGIPQSKFSRTSPDTSPRSPANNSDRRSSLHEPRGYRYSSLSTIHSIRQPSDSGTTAHARADQERPRQETDSTLSPTAPSAVWDELEDLKSRIGKLELTGKLPPPSHEAVSSPPGQRPQTAATTMTAFSSSPKHGGKSSNPSAGSETSIAVSQVHPLLQTALARANSVLSREVYCALETAVTDALKLSTVLGSGVPPSGSASVANGYGPADRKARRKADNLCRGLTELCIALSDDQLKYKQPPSRDEYLQSPRNGIDGWSATPSPNYQRSGSHEPEGTPRRRSTTRAASHLDARRSSLVNAGDNNVQVPSQIDSNHTQSSEAAPNRLNRLSTSSRTRRLQLEDENEGTASPRVRSISRGAMTEINTPPSRLPAGQQRASLDYRPSHFNLRSQQHQSTPPDSQPQPQQQKSQPTRTLSLSQSGIPSRKSYMSPGNYSPATARSNIQAGSHRYGFTPSPKDGSPAEGSGLPRPSQLEKPSQTKIAAPSSKLATSYTPIQQNRVRTNVQRTRSLGTRQHPMSAVDGAVHSFDDRVG